MAETAPDALKWLGSRVAPDLGGILSGIIGDRAHTRGYHRGRYYVPSTDYSAQLTEDKRGWGEFACAIDMSFSTSKMKLYTGRLKAAAERNDPRVKYVREFYGTLNGTDVFGRTHKGSSDSTWEWSTSDKSHLWHLHISILREYADNREVMRGILEVLQGKPYIAPAPTPAPVEEFVMATKEEVKAALREVLLEKTDFAASGPKARLTAGWGKMSVRELIDYIFESTRVDGVTNLPDDLARKLAPVVAAISNVDEEVLAQFAAQPTAQAKADLLRAVLGSEADAVFRAGLNQTGTTA